MISFFYYYQSEIMSIHFSSSTFSNSFQRKKKVSYPNAREIRRNPYYYTIYCVGLNTFFATLLPCSALIFFNCMTLRALRMLGNVASSTSPNDGAFSQDF